MKPSSNGVGTRLKDLIGLVANEAVDPHKVLEKSFDWQHLRALEVAKWSLAAASGLVAAVVVASVKLGTGMPDRSAQTLQADKWHALFRLISSWSMLIALGAGALITIGIAALRAASRTQRQYVVAQGLLARLNTIAPFLKRASEQIDLNS